jgi:hypothetical protein
MLNSGLSSERVEAARTQNLALYRWGPPLVTPWRAYDQWPIINVVIVLWCSSAVLNITSLALAASSQPTRNPPLAHSYEQRCLLDHPSRLHRREQLGSQHLQPQKFLQPSCRRSRAQAWCTRQPTPAEGRVLYCACACEYECVCVCVCVCL